MDSESLLRECIELLGKRNNIVGLTLEPNGCAGIELKDGRRIGVKLDRRCDRVYVYRAIMPAYSIDARALQRCMSLNLLEAGTAGGVLSLSGQMEALVYHRSVAARHLDVAWLQESMEALLDDGERIAQVLLEAQ